MAREKVKYYRRPAVPGGQASVPAIRYAPDVNHVPDDFTSDFLARRESCADVRR